MKRRRNRNMDVERLFGNPETLLGFMRRTRKPVFHNSNLFFRDIQCAIRDYFDTVEAQPITAPVAEQMARDVIQMYTDVGLLRKVDNQAYRLEAPEFSTPTGGTYSMLTVHGAPLPVGVENWLEMATVGSPVDPALREEIRDYKGGDVSPEGATIAALTLPMVASEEEARAKQLVQPNTEESHAYGLVGTDQGPQSQVQVMKPAEEKIVDEEVNDVPNDEASTTPPSSNMMPPWMTP
jgi:hypothetical protein